MARRDVTEEQLAAFGAALRDDREAADLSALSVSQLMDPKWRKSTATILNYETRKVVPPSPYIVLALERALKVPRGKYVRLLGWKVPKLDEPAVTRLGQDELMEARVDRMEQDLADLRSEAAASREAAERSDRTLRELVRLLADQLELPENLLSADPADH